MKSIGSRTTTVRVRRTKSNCTSSSTEEDTSQELNEVVEDPGWNHQSIVVEFGGSESFVGICNSSRKPPTTPKRTPDRRKSSSSNNKRHNVKSIIVGQQEDNNTNHNNNTIESFLCFEPDDLISIDASTTTNDSDNINKTTTVSSSVLNQSFCDNKPPRPSSTSTGTSPRKPRKNHHQQQNYNISENSFSSEDEDIKDPGFDFVFSDPNTTTSSTSTSSSFHRNKPRRMNVLASKENGLEDSGNSLNAEDDKDTGLIGASDPNTTLSSSHRKTRRMNVLTSNQNILDNDLEEGDVKNITTTTDNTTISFTHRTIRAPLRKDRNKHPTTTTTTSSSSTSPRRETSPKRGATTTTEGSSNDMKDPKKVNSPSPPKAVSDLPNIDNNNNNNNECFNENSRQTYIRATTRTPHRTIRKKNVASTSHHILGTSLPCLTDDIKTGNDNKNNDPLDFFDSSTESLSNNESFNEVNNNNDNEKRRTSLKKNNSCDSKRLTNALVTRTPRRAARKKSPTTSSTAIRLGLSLPCIPTDHPTIDFDTSPTSPNENFHSSKRRVVSGRTPLRTARNKIQHSSRSKQCIEEILCFEPEDISTDCNAKRNKNKSNNSADTTREKRVNRCQSFDASAVSSSVENNNKSRRGHRSLDCEKQRSSTDPDADDTTRERRVSRCKSFDASAVSSLVENNNTSRLGNRSYDCEKQRSSTDPDNRKVGRCKSFDTSFDNNNKFRNDDNSGFPNTSSFFPYGTTNSRTTEGNKTKGILKKSNDKNSEEERAKELNSGNDSKANVDEFDFSNKPTAGTSSGYIVPKTPKGRQRRCDLRLLDMGAISDLLDNHQPEEDNKNNDDDDEEVRIAMEMAIAAAKNPHLSADQIRELVGGSNSLQAQIVEQKKIELEQSGQQKSNINNNKKQQSKKKVASVGGVVHGITSQIRTQLTAEEELRKKQAEQQAIEKAKNAHSRDRRRSNVACFVNQPSQSSPSPSKTKTARSATTVGNESSYSNRVVGNR